MVRKPRRGKDGEPLKAMGGWFPEIWEKYSAVVQARHGLTGGNAAVVELALRELFEREGLIPKADASGAAGLDRAA